MANDMQSSDAFKAYQAAKKAIKDLVDGAVWQKSTHYHETAIYHMPQTQIDPQLLRAAKNGHIYSLVKKHSTPTATVRAINYTKESSGHLSR